MLHPTSSSTRGRLNGDTTSESSDFNSPTFNTPSHKQFSASSSVFDLPIAQEPRFKETSHIATPIARSTVFSSTPGQTPSYLVISGGTGGNSIVSAFGSDVTYVLPVSDNGGSSSEIIRVIGGPSIGDIRSRLIRLIPRASEGSPTECIRRLLSHRFPVDCAEKDVRDQWREVVEGRSELWRGIPADRKETIRGFLAYFESELLRRAHKRFSFRNGSIGNYFLTGAHLFFRSVPSAIFLFSSITGSQARILPVLVTNHTVTLAAELENGKNIIGQCEISHPVVRTPASSVPQIIQPEEEAADVSLDSDADEAEAEEPEVNSFFAKGTPSSETPLESRIKRVFYMNPYGQEVFPSPNQDFLTELRNRDVLVYSVGSLWTSIIPCLALQGVASAIAKSSTLRYKILLLNSCNDRETGGYTATEYVLAISQTLNRHDRQGRHLHNATRSIEPSSIPSVTTPDYPVSAFVTHLVYLEGTTVPVDQLALTALGVQCLSIRSSNIGKDGVPLYDSDDVKEALGRIVVGE